MRIPGRAQIPVPSWSATKVAFLNNRTEKMGSRPRPMCMRRGPESRSGAGKLVQGEHWKPRSGARGMGPGWVVALASGGGTTKVDHTTATLLLVRRNTE